MDDAFGWLKESDLACLGGAEWVAMAWSLAVDGIARGKTRVADTKDGIWRIACDSMKTIASLIPHGRIVARLHALHERRRLPELRGIAPIPPTEFGQPVAMLRGIAWRQMPEAMWRRFAWQMSVDARTAERTELAGTDHGVWRVVCHSRHAWEFLRDPTPVLGMLAWIDRMRPLGVPQRLVVTMGDVRDDGPAREDGMPSADNTADNTMESRWKRTTTKW